jgi:hypothetical protein
MSDTELRKILRDVIDDLDQGRVRVPGRLPWKRVAGAMILSAGLGLGGLAGCNERALGADTDASSADASVTLDSGSGRDGAQPYPDGGVITAYGEPFLDGGILPPYSQPFLDGGSNEDYSAPPVLDGGNDSLYSAPAYMAPPAPEPAPAPAPAPEPESESEPS